MSYIGKEPQYADFLSKFFNGDGTAMTVTLDAAPPNEAALLVFIDGVRQDTSAYTVSGYSLTFTGVVPSGTNNVQVVHLGIAQDTQVPVDDSVSTVKIQDDAVTSAKLANSLNITSGNSLTIDSGATVTNNGTASGFGKVLQVVSATKTDAFSTTSSSYTAITGLSASITPSSTSSKILVICSHSVKQSVSEGIFNTRIHRDGTGIGMVSISGKSSGENRAGGNGLIVLDSPSSTSSLTYQAYTKRYTGSVTISINSDGGTSTILLMEIAG